jgi:hypothetical protein
VPRFKNAVQVDHRYRWCQYVSPQAAVHKSSNSSNDDDDDGDDGSVDNDDTRTTSTATTQSKIITDVILVGCWC